MLLDRVLLRAPLVRTGAIHEGIESCALVECRADPSPDGVDDRTDFRVGGQLARELQGHVDLAKHVAQRAHAREEVFRIWIRSPVELSRRRDRHPTAGSPVRLAEGGRVTEGLGETGADPGDVGRSVRVLPVAVIRPRTRQVDELDTVLCPVTLEQPRNVDLDALLRDPELRRDLLVRLAAGDISQDHVLSLRERSLNRHERKYMYFWSLSDPSMRADLIERPLEMTLRHEFYGVDGDGRCSYRLPVRETRARWKERRRDGPPHHPRRRVGLLPLGRPRALARLGADGWRLTRRARASPADPARAGRHERERVSTATSVSPSMR